MEKPKYNFIKYKLDTRYLFLIGLSHPEYVELDLNLLTVKDKVVLNGLRINPKSLLAIHNLDEDIEKADRRFLDSKFRNMTFNIRDKKGKVTTTKSITDLVESLFKRLASEYGAIMIVSASDIESFKPITGYLPDRLDL